MTVAYTAMAVVMTWPLVTNVGDRLAGDLGDPAFNAWVLAWTSGQVLRAISFEAFGIGVVASALGLFGGIGLAFGLQQLLNAVGFDLPSKGLVIEPASLVIAGTIGLVVTMVAALAPAVKASKVPPLAALRDIAVERSSIGTARTIAAVLLGAGGIGLVTTATIWPEGRVARKATALTMTATASTIPIPPTALMTFEARLSAVRPRRRDPLAVRLRGSSASSSNSASLSAVDRAGLADSLVRARGGGARYTAGTG